MSLPSVETVKDDSSNDDELNETFAKFYEIEAEMNREIFQDSNVIHANVPSISGMPVSISEAELRDSQINNRGVTRSPSIVKPSISIPIVSQSSAKSSNSGIDYLIPVPTVSRAKRRITTQTQLAIPPTQTGKLQRTTYRKSTTTPPEHALLTLTQPQTPSTSSQRFPHKRKTKCKPAS